MNKFEEAANDYIKSTELDENFVFSHIQLAVALYKTGQLSKAMETFRATLAKFPQRSEPYNY
jgi:mitochondrial import receptor subunit TOM70